MTDSESDLVVGEGKNALYPIEPARLLVFPHDSDIPRDELNTQIDRYFVPMARVEPPAPGGLESWRAALKAELRRVTFRAVPERVPPARTIEAAQGDVLRLESEPGIEVGLQPSPPAPAGKATRLLLVVRNADGRPPCDWLARVRLTGDEVWLCAGRGVDGTRWTRKNPPNYVERAHALFGRTVDTGRVWDIAAAARYLHARGEGQPPVYVAGEGPAAVLAAYAALWEPDIAGALLARPPLSHMDGAAPPLLNVLRVCDIPDVLGMLAPRPLVVYAPRAATLDKVAAIYKAAGAAGKFVRKAE